MNKTVVAALSLSVISLGLAIFALARPPGPEVQPSSSSAMGNTAVAADTAAYETRLHALEVTADILARRVRSLEVAMVADGGVPQVMPSDPALEAQVKALQGQVRDLSTGMVLDSDSGKQAMKDYVKEAQQQLAEEQQKQRTADWAQNFTQQQTEKMERWKKFVGEASLNYSQETLLMQKMTEEQQKQQALIDQVRSGEKRPRDIRDDLRAARSDTDEAMKQSLSADQFKQYQEQRQQDRGPGRGGGGFGGFGGFGSGGRQQGGGEQGQ